MLTTSKPNRGWRRPAVAAGLIVLLAGCTPPGPRALLDGERLIREGRSEDAIKRLRSAVQFLPLNAQAWNHLGLAYHGAKRPSEAAEAYQQALRLDRNLAVAYFNTGCLYLEYGEATLATDAMWAYVGLQPRVVEGWVKLGQAQLRTRKWNQAERSFEEALRLNPSRVDAWNGLGVSLQQGRKVREAWQAFTNAVMRDPGFAPAWLNLGVIAHHNGSPTKAVQAYRQYSSLRPESALQMDLAGVIGRLETPPTPPAVQSPPENPAPRSEAVPAGSTPPTSSPAGAASGAAVDPPDPGDGVSEAPSVASTEVAVPDDPGQARPPPDRVATGVASVVAEDPAQPPADASGEGASSVSSQTPPIPAPDAAASSISNAIPPPPAASLATAPSAIPGSNTVASESFELPVPVPVPVPAPVSPPPSIAATGGTGSPAAPATTDRVPIVPVDRVEIQPAENLVMGVRDEEGAAVSSGGGSGEAGLPPLVRPVAAQRSTPGTDRQEKRGFWSRANPVGWFGSDDTQSAPPAEEVAAKAEGEGEGEGEGGAWRWANPMTWFRGNSETNIAGISEAGDPSPAGPGPEVAKSDVVTPPGALVAPGVTNPPVATASVTNREATASAGAAPVRRAQAPMWAARPVPAGSEPAVGVERAADPEVRRYAYLRPAKPAPGNRNAAQGVMAQAQEEHRRDRTVEAVRLYEEALLLDPSLSEAYLELAVAAMELGDVRRALAAGESALALQPQARVARLNFALALDQAGYPVDAAAEAEKVVTAKPDLVAGHLLLGNLNAQKLGRPAEARAHYLRVIELEPEHPQSVAIRRWLARNP